MPQPPSHCQAPGGTEASVTSRAHSRAYWAISMCQESRGDLWCLGWDLACPRGSQPQRKPQSSGEAGAGWPRPGLASAWHWGRAPGRAGEFHRAGSSGPQRGCHEPTSVLVSVLLDRSSPGPLSVPVRISHVGREGGRGGTAGLKRRVPGPSSSASRLDGLWIKPSHPLLPKHPVFFPRAVVTPDLELGGFVLSQFWRLTSKRSLPGLKAGGGRAGSFWGLQGRVSFLPLEASGGCWPSLACGCIPPVSASVFRARLLLCQISCCLPLPRTLVNLGPVHTIRGHFLISGSFLSSHLQRPVDRVRDHSQVPGIMTWCLWGPFFGRSPIPLVITK